ncbi:MAG: LamG-like jellyroll fold domain-containing protein, partial [Fibrobacterota bacterium]
LGTSTYAGISVPAPVNQWVHFAATYDSATSTINIFTNGVLAASTPNDAGGSPLNGQRLRQTTLPLTFGFAPSFANTYFNGSIDEVRIWNFARSGAEISRDFHARLAGTEPGLVGYWQFDGGTVTDLTTNANNGSLVGGAQIVAITGADIPHLGAPTIPQLSQSLAVAPGTNVTFTVAATSIAPLSYQWFKDGVFLTDQTNAQLNLSGLTNRARGGSFSVMVSNLYGAITGNIGSIRVRVPHRLQPPVATNGMFRLLSADQDGGLLTTNDLAFFTFQTSTNLTPTNWLSITYTNGLSLTNGMLRFDDTNTASRPFRYYRVIEQ